LRLGPPAFTTRCPAGRKAARQHSGPAAHLLPQPGKSSPASGLPGHRRSNTMTTISRTKP